MEKTYLVCFDFNKIREKFDPNDEYNYECAVEFMEECYRLKDFIVLTFPNFSIPLTNNSFLIKSLLTQNELLDLLQTKLEEKTFNIKDEHHIIKQIYVAEISSLKSNTFRTKKLEIEYLTNVICKQK